MSSFSSTSGSGNTDAVTYHVVWVIDHINHSSRPGAEGETIILRPMPTIQDEEDDGRQWRFQRAINHRVDVKFGNCECIFRCDYWYVIRIVFRTVKGFFPSHTSPDTGTKLLFNREHQKLIIETSSEREGNCTKEEILYMDPNLRELLDIREDHVGDPLTICLPGQKDDKGKYIMWLSGSIMFPDYQPGIDVWAKLSETKACSKLSEKERNRLPISRKYWNNGKGKDPQQSSKARKRDDNGEDDDFNIASLFAEEAEGKGEGNQDLGGDT